MTMMYITCYKRERKGGNQITIYNNSTTVSRHMSLYMEKDAPLHMEDDIVEHLGRQQKASFGYLMASHVPLE